MTAELEALIDRVIDDDDWSRVTDAGGFAPAERVEAARRRWPVAASQGRSRLAWWLGATPSPEGDALLLELVDVAEGDDAAALLRAITTRELVAPTPVLVRLLAARGASSALALAAVAAAGASGDLALAPLVAAHLDGPVAMNAAIELGRLRATAFTSALLERLPARTSLDFAGFAVGLELMADGAAIAPLRALVPRLASPELWSVHAALVALTGYDPVVPVDLSLDEGVAATRAAWANADLVSPRRPSISGVIAAGEGELDFVVRDGAGLIRVDDDTPSPGSSWPRWYRSLRVAGQPLYQVGSTCGTCETTLRHLGWPPPIAAAHAATVRDTIGDLGQLTAATLDALAPLLGGLRSGQCVAALVELDLTRTDGPDGSCWQRRLALRIDEDGECDDDDTPAWPGVAHFELRQPLPGAPPTFGAVMPTQPLDALDPTVVARHADAIRGGARPAAIVLAWIDRRQVQARFDEQFLLGLILDGHHKLAAYAGLGVPARVLLVCRLEDTWGPPGDRARWFRDAVRSTRS